MAFLGLFLVAPTQACLAFVGHNTWACIIAFIGLLFVHGLFMIAALPALYVESQSVLEDMELEEPGIMGSEGAVAQAFSLQTMAQFVGLFLGPLCGGFIMYCFGWKIVCWTLAFLIFVSSIPMIWLSSKPRGRLECFDGESEPLIQRESE